MGLSSIFYRIVKLLHSKVSVCQVFIDLRGHGVDDGLVACKLDFLLVDWRVVVGMALVFSLCGFVKNGLGLFWGHGSTLNGVISQCGK